MTGYLMTGSLGTAIDTYPIFWNLKQMSFTHDRPYLYKEESPDETNKTSKVQAQYSQET